MKCLKNNYFAGKNPQNLKSLNFSLQLYILKAKTWLVEL